MCLIIILNLCLYSIFNFVYKCYCGEIIDILFLSFHLLNIKKNWLGSQHNRFMLRKLEQKVYNTMQYWNVAVKDLQSLSQPFVKYQILIIIYDPPSSLWGDNYNN